VPVVVVRLPRLQPSQLPLRPGQPLLAVFPLDPPAALARHPLAVAVEAEPLGLVLTDLHGLDEPPLGPVVAEVGDAQDRVAVVVLLAPDVHLASAIPPPRLRLALAVGQRRHVPDDDPVEGPVREPHLSAAPTLLAAARDDQPNAVDDAPQHRPQPQPGRV